MENKEVEVLYPGASKPVKQDIGGMFVMRMSDWEAVKAELEACNDTDPLPEAQ